MSLIVVESPTKARTFNRILKQKKLDDKYFVFATVGHFRDLPSKSIAVDIEHDFEPDYEIMNKKENIVEKLKELAKENDEILLATDPDREGESISYHIAYVLGYIDEKWPDFKIHSDGKQLKRVIFHEITPKAFEEALDHPEELRIDLVKAQQARRILDRVVGYKLSPLLWKKMGKNWLSAGRVQTVALRLVVEREKEREKFEQEPYFQIYSDFKTSDDVLNAHLVSKDGEKYEVSTTIQLFDGEYTYTKTTIDEAHSKTIESDLKEDSFSVTSVEEKEVEKYPPPPFTTSLLQQTAYQALRFPSKLTMRIAQSLFQKGLITYHRTDSFNLSSKFVFGAKDYIVEKFGKEYALEKPRGYKTRSKNAQEAHEAIRPTYVKNNPAEKMKRKLNEQEKKLYTLIYNRALATQMQPAKVKQVTAQIKSGKGYELEATAEQVLFDGFLKLYPERRKEGKQITVKEGESLHLEAVNVQEKKTWPPYRYNEASLIKTLEQKSIGRPSTYSAILSLIIDKHYVEKERGYLKPTPLGTSMSDYLSDAFPQIFDLQFTAEIEDSLDDISNGNKEMVELLKSFYKPFEKELTVQEKDKSKIDVDEEKLDEPCEKCGGEMVAKYGKYGKFFACNNYPKCKNIKSIQNYVGDAYKCPKCGGRFVVRYSKKGRKFYGCENFPTCKHLQWKLKGTEAEVSKK